MESRPQFGARLLNEGEDVFKHNAWDNVEWGEQQEEEAQQQVDQASMVRVGGEQAEQFEVRAAEHWDKFYSVHQNRFFKERNWLFTEFPDLAPGYVGGRVRVFPSHKGGVTGREESEPQKDSNYENSEAKENLQTEPTVIDQSSIDQLRENESYFGAASDFRLFEVGCGTGSSVFPILEVNGNPGLMVYCCDLSPQAVQLVRDHTEYNKGRCHAMVCDVTNPADWEAAPFPPGSLDVVTLIFVLSAISPERMKGVLANIFFYLKPGGQVMFRDYGRYDLAQLRFKPGKCISDNFYVRGDGTRCYFFTQGEVRASFEGVGFEEQQNLVDRRLQVNRGKKLKMYRVWLQAKYRKPLTNCDE